MNNTPLIYIYTDKDDPDWLVFYETEQYFEKTWIQFVEALDYETLRTKGTVIHDWISEKVIDYRGFRFHLVVKNGEMVLKKITRISEETVWE